MKVANQNYLSTKNQQSVLNAIFLNQPISRAQLARMLNSSKPAIADNVNKLLDIGVVEELVKYEKKASVGRKPIMLGINKNFKHIVVIAFYYEKTMFVFYNLQGELINEITVEQTPHKDFDSWMPMAINMIKALLASVSLKKDDLAAICISTPGVISEEKDNIINIKMHGAFNPSTIIDNLKKEFNCLIRLKNATNASTLGEWYNGLNRSCSNLLYVTCGSALGSGMIINNKLYEGNNFAAGEIANFITEKTIKSKESLEQRISVPGFIKRLNAAKNTNIDLKFNDLVDLYNNHDKDVLNILEDIANELGYVICNLVMSMNYDMVIIGGEYQVFSDTIIPIIQNLVNKNCIVPCDVKKSFLGEQSISIGMAVLGREIYFNEISGVAKYNRK